MLQKIMNKYDMHTFQLSDRMCKVHLLLKHQLPCRDFNTLVMYAVLTQQNRSLLGSINTSI